MKNQLGQTVTAHLEMENGEMAQLGLYIARLLRSQDLEAWKSDPEALNKWVRACVCDFVNHCTVTIVTRA